MKHGWAPHRAKRFALVAGAASLAVFASFPAQADVLEIGQSGAQWVAGGPQPNAEPELALDEDALAIDQASLTQALDAAGPERWRAHVAQLAAKYDISPALLEAVIWQESRWNEGARSHAGARGLAQLMPGTAQQMGVDADNPQANLEGGARYLREQLDTFGGDIEKALAAYNAGPRRVAQAGGIPRIRETQAYVAAIMGRLADPVRK
ncbi:lytic transglycosylase domain-containing protein [Novosphingobium sp. BW1]|uniref:lytic transglycosylase domain-containing protein n=1 Tax=Novosphingobium sp. BW1 TaxID=2592621 RepID=UPI0011DE8591|nr:lytic transglycosylase domain-containing protein [Novosphingobium sp. BW1]TYC90040.1 lytic transglycosylase domain-containing protein [Novosphingobium sp. BW1]